MNNVSWVFSLCIATFLLSACEQSYEIGAVDAAKTEAPPRTLPVVAPPRTLPVVAPPRTLPVVAPPTSGAIGGVSNPVVIPTGGACARNAACTLQGQHFGQYAANISTTRTTYRVGEAIDVRWNSFPNMGGNWITIVPSNFEGNSWCAWFWNASAASIVSGSAPSNTPPVSNGNVAGSAYFVASEPGTFEIRGYYGWINPGQCEVIGSKIVTIIR